MERKEVEKDLQEEPVQFRNYLRSMKAGKGKYKFGLIWEFMDFLMSQPHSSASAESQFSLLKLIKSPLRNKLKPKTISALMHAHRFLPRNVGTWKISSRLILAAKKWKVTPLKNKQKK